MNISARVNLLNNATGPVVAMADIILNSEVDGTDGELVLKGFKVINGKSGLFVGFPSQKNAEGEYKDTIITTKEDPFRAAIQEAVLEKYNEITGASKGVGSKAAPASKTSAKKSSVPEAYLSQGKTSGGAKKASQSDTWEE